MRKSGFSLLEILIVVAIILILAGSLTPLLSTSKQEAREAKTKSDLDAIKTAAIMCHADTGSWPVEDTTGNDIVTDDSSFTGWDGPYLDEWRLDPWDRAYEVKDGAGNTRYVTSQGPTAGFEGIFPTGTDDIYYMITGDHTK